MYALKVKETGVETSLANHVKIKADILCSNGDMSVLDAFRQTKCEARPTGRRLAALRIFGARLQANLERSQLGEAILPS